MCSLHSVVPWCCVRCARALEPIWIDNTGMRMRDNTGSVVHELVHKLIPTTLLGTLRAGLHIHSLVLLIVVVDGTSFFLASLTVLREVRTLWHKFSVQARPIVHTCTSMQTTSSKRKQLTDSRCLWSARYPHRIVQESSRIDEVPKKTIVLAHYNEPNAQESAF